MNRAIISQRITSILAEIERLNNALYCAMIVSMHQRCCSTTALRCVIVNPFFIFSTTSFPSFKCIVLRLRPQFP